MGIRDWWTPKPPSEEVPLNTALEEMGVSFHRTVEAGTGRANIPELQRRWFEGKRHFREHRLWILALASAIASVVSALTALFAVLTD